MGDLSSHFSTSEFKCKCGCKDLPIIPLELLNILEDLKSHFDNKIVRINSGFRCCKHNKNIGGSRYSQHLLGKAADVVVEGINAKEVQKYVLEKHKHKYGIGSYETFTHIDVRMFKARW